jgi:hypothetical protein
MRKRQSIPHVKNLVVTISCLNFLFCFQGHKEKLQGYLKDIIGYELQQGNKLTSQWQAFLPKYLIKDKPMIASEFIRAESWYFLNQILKGNLTINVKRL